MPGPVPGIHVLEEPLKIKDVDGRDTPGHDELDCLEADRNAMCGEISLRLTNPKCSEMKDRGGEDRGRMAVANPFDEMVERPDPARGDDRHPHRIGDGAGQRDIEAGFGAVAVHRGQQDLAGAVIREAAGPFDSVDAGRPSPAMGEYFPFALA